MSGFGAKKTDLDELNEDQLRERLMVAETIMKKLYNRNKELEKWYEANSNKQFSPMPLPEPTETNDNDTLGAEGNGRVNEMISQMKIKQTELEEEIGIKEQ